VYTVLKNETEFECSPPNLNAVHASGDDSWLPHVPQRIGLEVEPTLLLLFGHLRLKLLLHTRHEFPLPLRVLLEAALIFGILEHQRHVHALPHGDRFPP